MNIDMNKYLIFRLCIDMLINYCKKNVDLSAEILVLGYLSRHLCLQSTLLVGERAKQARHYLGCTNSSWYGTHVIVIVWVLGVYQNKTLVSRGRSLRVRAFCSDVPRSNHGIIIFSPKSTSHCKSRLKILT